MPLLWICMRTSLIFMVLTCWGVTRSLYSHAQALTHFDDQTAWLCRTSRWFKCDGVSDCCDIMLKKPTLAFCLAGRQHSCALSHQWLSQGSNLTCRPRHVWQNLLLVRQKNPHINTVCLCPTGQHMLTLCSHIDWTKAFFFIAFSALWAPDLPCRWWSCSSSFVAKRNALMSVLEIRKQLHRCHISDWGLVCKHVNRNVLLLLQQCNTNGYADKYLMRYRL